VLTVFVNPVTKDIVKLFEKNKTIYVKLEANISQNQFSFNIF